MKKVPFFIANIALVLSFVLAATMVSRAQINPGEQPGGFDTRARPVAAISRPQAELSPWSMFLSADILVKAVMISLAFASLVTWTIFLAKTLQLATARRRLTKALYYIRDEPTLSDAQRALSKKGTVLLSLLAAATEELRLSAGCLAPSGIKERAVSRFNEIARTEARAVRFGLGVLATIGSTSPFVGLFGTVWGIMNSFIGISRAQSTNLAVVAPGIAEALLATAIGLVAAIPAVIIYNHLTRGTRGYLDLVTRASGAVGRLLSRHLDFADSPAGKSPELAGTSATEPPGVANSLSADGTSERWIGSTITTLLLVGMASAFVPVSFTFGATQASCLISTVDVDRADISCTQVVEGLDECRQEDAVRLARVRAVNDGNRFDHVASDFFSVLALEPSTVGALPARRFGLLRAVDCQKPIAGISEAIRVPHANAGVYSNRGYPCAQTWDRLSALPDYAIALRLQPASTSAYCNRSVIVPDMRPHDNAIAHSIRAIDRPLFHSESSDERIRDHLNAQSPDAGVLVSQLLALVVQYGWQSDLGRLCGAMKVGADWDCKFKQISVTVSESETFDNYGFNVPISNASGPSYVLLFRLRPLIGNFFVVSPFGKLLASYYRARGVEYTEMSKEDAEEAFDEALAFWQFNLPKLKEKIAAERGILPPQDTNPIPSPSGP